MSLTEKIKKMVQKSQERKRQGTHDEHGRLICDPDPLKFPCGMKKPPTQEERLRRILAAHHEQMTFNANYVDETNFDIDEPDMLTPYERNNIVFETIPEYPSEPVAKRAPNAGEAEGSSSVAKPKDE